MWWWAGRLSSILGGDTGKWNVSKERGWRLGIAKGKGCTALSQRARGPWGQQKWTQDSEARTAGKQQRESPGWAALALWKSEQTGSGGDLGQAGIAHCSPGGKSHEAGDTRL